MTDITEIRCTLFGVCTSKELHAQVAQAWKKRFSARTAFLVDAEADADALTVVESILKSIEAEKMEGLSRGRETCILAYFFDLTKSVAETQLEAFGKIARRLETALHCNIAATLQFGYVGRAALSDGKTIPENVKATVAQNERDPRRTQLILVASPSLATTAGSIWQRPMLLLDILRRTVAPALILPQTADGKTNNDIGFLSYEEYNDGAREALLAQIKALESVTGNQGADRFEKRLQAYLSEKKEALRARFTVNAGMQPQHPDMIVPEGGLSNRQKKAARGAYEPYNAAQTQTANAMFQTGEALHKSVVDFFALSDQAADDLLMRLIDESELGLELARDKCAVKSLLTYAGKVESRPPAPALAYRPEGVVEEVNQYFSALMTHAAYYGSKNLYEKLLSAYERIPDTYFRDIVDRKKSELSIARSRIAEMFTAEDFYERALFGQLALRSELSSADPTAISRSYLTVRGEKFQAMAEKIENRNGAFSAESYYVDPNTGGIQKQDNAPFKILRLTLLDCSDDSLRSVFPEV